MAAPAELMFDVRDAGFAETVVARSHEVPVLLAFWAPWCGPCRALAPVLEKVTSDLGGEIVLARMNIDECPQTPARMGVRGVPNIHLFSGGRSVGQFSGARPEPMVRAFIRGHVPSEADTQAGEGERALSAGDVAGAKVAFERAREADPGCARARLGLARVALSEGDAGTAREHAAAVPAGAEQRDAADAIAHAADLAAEAASIGDRAAIANRLDADPNDLEARYALAGHAVAEGRYREALDELLAVVNADRRWRDEAARKGMLAVFALVGPRSELANDYRRRLMLIT